MSTPLSEDDVNLLRIKIGYLFNDPGILQIALNPTRNTNTRLAILGKAVIRYVLLEYWYHEPGSTIGDGIDQIWQTASITELDRKGRESEITYFIRETCAQQPPTQITQRMMAFTVEALLGAVYLDSRLDIQDVQTAMTYLGL